MLVTVEHTMAGSLGDELEGEEKLTLLERLAVSGGLSSDELGNGEDRCGGEEVGAHVG